MDVLYASKSDLGTINWGASKLIRSGFVGLNVTRRNPAVGNAHRREESVKAMLLSHQRGPPDRPKDIQKSDLAN
jgi:hypothetical protein